MCLPLKCFLWKNFKIEPNDSFLFDPLNIHLVTNSTGSSVVMSVWVMLGKFRQNTNLIPPLPPPHCPPPHKCFALKLETHLWNVWTFSLLQFMRGWGNLLHLNKRGHGPVRYMAYNIENLSGTLLVFFGYRPNTYIEWLLKPGACIIADAACLIQ